MCCKMSRLHRVNRYIYREIKHKIIVELSSSQCSLIQDNVLYPTSGYRRCFSRLQEKEQLRIVPLFIHKFMPSTYIIIWPFTRNRQSKPGSCAGCLILPLHIPSVMYNLTFYILSSTWLLATVKFSRPKIPITSMLTCIVNVRSRLLEPSQEKSIPSTSTQKL